MAACVAGVRAGHAPHRAMLGEADLQRMKAEAEAEGKRRKAIKCLEKYDTDKSGKLDREQLTSMLTDLDSSTPPGTAPSDEEVKFILASADFTGTTFGFADGCIGTEEIVDAIVAWQTWTSHREYIDGVFEKFDAEKNGQLNKAELKAYLTQLNGDVDVTDHEVAWVLKISDLSHTGQLNKPEVLRATAEWFVYVKKGKSHDTCFCC